MGVRFTISIQVFVVFVAHIGTSYGCWRAPPARCDGQTTNCMTSLCNGNDTISTVTFSRVTQLRPSPAEYPSNMDCSVVMKAGVNSSTRIQLELAWTAIDSSPNCTEDSLRIYDGSAKDGTAVDLTAPHGICGSHTGPIFFDSSVAAVTVKFTSNNMTNLFDRRGFLIKATQFYYGSCGKQDFQCRNQKCIPIELRCNGDNNCGDGSDEDRKMCQKRQGCSFLGCGFYYFIILSILGCSCGACLLLSIICAGCCGCCHKLKQIVSPAPDVNHAEAPPSYEEGTTASPQGLGRGNTNKHFKYADAENGGGTNIMFTKVAWEK